MLECTTISGRILESVPEETVNVSDIIILSVPYLLLHYCSTCLLLTGVYDTTNNSSHNIARQQAGLRKLDRGNEIIPSPASFWGITIFYHPQATRLLGVLPTTTTRS